MVPKIPIIDIQAIGLRRVNPSLDDYASVGRKLDNAFKEIGFAYLSNHGVQQDTVEQGMQISEKFFKQDVAEKSKFKREVNKGDVAGWVAQGRENFREENGEKRGIMEIREAFDIFNTSPTARLPEAGGATDRKTFQDLSQQSIDLSTRILRALSLVLDKDLHFLENLHRNMMKGNNKSTMRTLFYPPIEGPVQPGTIRCGEHSDYGTLTLLYQDSYPGLEVKSTSGEWVAAPSIAGSLLVNIGDLMEMWTNGDYPATVHRVMIPEEEVTRRCARQSIVFFVHPDDEVLVEPLSNENPAKYPSITALKHVQNRFSQTYKY